MQMLAQANTSYSQDSASAKTMYSEFLAYEFLLKESRWKRQAKH